MKIVHRKPFYWGTGITMAQLFMFTFADEMGSVSSGPAIQHWPLLGRLILLCPGVLVMINGLFPGTTMGKIGGAVYHFFIWIFRSTKK